MPDAPTPETNSSTSKNPTELAGRLVGVTAERKSEAQERFLHTRGAATLMAPTLKTLDLSDRPELLEIAKGIADTPPAVLVVQTGQGLKWWLDSLPEGLSAKVLEGLGQTEIWCRGPKASSMTKRLGLTVAWQAPKELAADIAERLEAADLSGKQVMVQLDGSSGQELMETATLQGAEAVALNVYRYELPDDISPVARLIDGVIDGSIDAITITASPQIRHLRQIASSLGKLSELDAAFTGQCLAAVVGPVCAETARKAGWTKIVEPETARLMPMLETLKVALAAE